MIIFLRLKMNKKNILIFFGISFLIYGCYNMPTPTSQITGTYTSGLKYTEFDCITLASELNNVARREAKLVIAQEQRIKTSQTQALWVGYGQGDGIEAAELASARGEKEAILQAMTTKNCQINVQLEDKKEN